MEICSLSLQSLRINGLRSESQGTDSYAKVLDKENKSTWFLLEESLCNETGASSF